MSPIRPLRPTLWIVVLFLAAMYAQARSKALPVVRWSMGSPGCEFQLADDGHYRWKMVSGDLTMTLIVDSKELTKSRFRLYRMLPVYLSVNYTGAGKVEFPAVAKMEFVRHHHVIEGYLNSDKLSNRMQNDVDSLVFETEREIKKHPEKSEEKLARAREDEKEISELIEFLSTQSLQEAILTPGNPEVHGWLFYGTKNKWIGPWKSREDFILRVGMKDRIWEFPFSLPPDERGVTLRTREE